MKLHILADLHMEFGSFEMPDTDADVVILAGDTHVGVKGIEWANAIGKPVIYVAGNHEYYGSGLWELNVRMRDMACPNVYFLENNEVTIEGVRFLGATLWTDFQLFGTFAQSMMVAGDMMNDYRQIWYGPAGQNLRARNTLTRHKQSREWLTESLDRNFPGPTVVVTHHSPSALSADPRYRDDALAPAFSSDVGELMGKAPLWVHGHTHHCVDYELGGTRVLSNQRGYPRENTTFDPGLVITV
jgi:predicted phosphodiesterase